MQQVSWYYEHLQTLKGICEQKIHHWISIFYYLESIAFPWSSLNYIFIENVRKLGAKGLATEVTKQLTVSEMVKKMCKIRLNSNIQQRWRIYH